MPRILIDLDHTLLATTQFKVALEKQPGNIDSLLPKLHLFLYADSISFLETAIRLGYEVIIVTFGEEVWQQKKIQALQLYLPTAVKTLISPTQKINHIKHLLTDRVILIDDRAEEIDAIKQAFPKVEAYWMRRPEGKYRDEEPTTPHQTINSLKQIKL